MATADDARIEPVAPVAGARAILPIAQGGSWYDRGATDADVSATIAAAYDSGIRHFDTAARYAGGRSEQLLGRFVRDRREEVFIASKSDTAELTADAMLAEVEGSLARLGIDCIDLYYIHWPRAGRDMRPTMEGLERARQQGKIAAIGVSNFSVDQMAQVQQVGRIAAHQLGYNLLWRHTETSVIPYCAAHGISVIPYSVLGHGILTGKFGRTPALAPGDQRHSILPFRSDIWPHVFEGVEALKASAAALDLPLATLAIRWALARPGVTAVVAGAHTAAQARAHVAALEADIPASTLSEITAISDAIMAHIPDAGNLFNHYP